MWQNLSHLDIPPFNLALRAVVVYLSILFLLRISGKRQIGQMGATEFVAILLISNAVQNSMNGGDNSLLGGLLLAAILILVSTFISALAFQFPLFSAIFEGKPTLLVHKGKLIRRNLIRERMREKDLKALLRKQGIADFHDIGTAVLEIDGTLSVTKMSEIHSGL